MMDALLGKQTDKVAAAGMRCDHSTTKSFVAGWRTFDSILNVYQFEFYLKSLFDCAPPDDGAGTKVDNAVRGAQKRKLPLLLSKTKSFVAGRRTNDLHFE